MSALTASAVIALVARLINDPGYQIFTTDQIYAVLMGRAWEARYSALRPVAVIEPGGTGSYLIFQTSDPAWGHWETDTALLDGAYGTLSPGTSDWTLGRWTFTVQPDPMPVRILGISHDPYGAAADLLEMRAAELAEEVESFTSLTGSVAFANRRSGPLQLAQVYRRRARQLPMAQAYIPRSDLRPSD